MPNCDQCLEERPPHPEHQRRCGLNDCEFANGDQVEQGLTGVANSLSKLLSS